MVVVSNSLFPPPGTLLRVAPTGQSSCFLFFYKRVAPTGHVPILLDLLFFIPICSPQWGNIFMLLHVALCSHAGAVVF